MASCRACGAALGRQFRFCSQCGTAAGVELDLLDLAPPAHEEVTVQFGRSGRFWAAVAGGVVAVALGLRLLAGLGGGGGTDSTTDHDRPTTTVPAATSTATTPTTSVAARVDDGTATSVVGEGGPLLGQSVGLSLIVGTDQRLRRIDLDTGVVTSYDKAAMPLFVTGDQVLLQSSAGAGTVRSAPVDDLDAETPPLWSQDSPAMPVPGPEPGQVWLPGIDGDTLVWRLMDAATRQVSQEIDTGASPWWQSASTSLDPIVVGSSTGDVFERDGDRYQLVAHGELVAVGRSTVLVRRCADPSSCSLHWIDRATRREVDRPLPDIDAQELAVASVSDDGRLLLYATATGSGALFDVSRGTQVTATETWPDNLAVSADGRWVAVLHLGGRIVVYDVEAGKLDEIPVSSAGGARLVLAASG